MNIISNFTNNRKFKYVIFDCTIKLTSDSPSSVWGKEYHLISLKVTKNFILDVSERYIGIVKTQLNHIYGKTDYDLVSTFNIQLIDLVYDEIINGFKKEVNLNDYDKIKSISIEDGNLFNNIEKSIKKNSL